MATLDVDPTPAAVFGELLRHRRLALGLTQETLAERAGLSAHAIQRLERGSSQPYRDTAERLICALHLAGQDEIRFRAAAQPAPRRRPGAVSTKPSSADRGRHNLPHQTTSFVGRQDDVARVKVRLGENRLVTITGAGGCGKTRLALEVGRAIVDELSDGVWFIDLAPLSDASLVWQPLAAVLGIREEPGGSVADAVAGYLRDRTTLIILDNCEHLIEACATTVDTLLREAANLRVLATSRELLGVAGEAAWPLRSLSVIDPRDLETGSATPDALLASEALRLFVDRARMLSPAFEVTSENAPTVAKICHRLDGIPLAIELAAVSLSVLRVDELAARLDQRFRLLTGGYRTVARRQQTLQATIDWSYELLTEPERALLRSLSVFAGGWSLEAAEAVSSVAVGPGEGVLELLNQLVRKSMVIVDEVREHGFSATRYRFLETIRQYAEERLLSSEAKAARSRHADWYVGLAELAEEGLESSDQFKWRDRLEVEIDNLRAALTRMAAQPHSDRQLLHFVGLLGRFWRDRGSLQEGVSWLEVAVDHMPPPTPPTADHVRALNWLGAFALHNGDVQRARTLLEESVAHARAVEDARLLSLVLRHQGFAFVPHRGGFSAFEDTQFRGQQDYERARQLFEEALGVSREIANKREIAWNLGALAMNEIRQGGDHSNVRELLEESIAFGRESGDLTPVLYSMAILARIYAATGAAPQARRIIDEGLTAARQNEMHTWIALLLTLSGDVAARQRDWDTAGDLYRQALRLLTASAARANVAYPVRRYAALLGARGEHRRALRLLSAVATVDDAIWGDRSTLEIDMEAVMNAARSALGDRGFADAWAEGESMTLAQASAEILEE